MSQWEMINDLRRQLNVKQIAEDMANLVIDDLKEEGFEAKLIKYKEKKPKTWKIVSVNVLDNEEQKRFDEIKERQVTYYRDTKIGMIKDIKRSITG